MRETTLSQKLGAEFLGTFWLVFAGAGTAVFAATFVAGNVVAGQSLHLGVGFLGVALAFGLTLVAGIYAVGHISGGHFNPAVSIGFALAGRTEWRHIPGYIVAQLVGGVVGAGVVALIAAPLMWVTVKASLFASVSLLRTSKVTAVSSAVVTVSAAALGAAFLEPPDPPDPPPPPAARML